MAVRRFSFWTPHITLPSEFTMRMPSVARPPATPRPASTAALGPVNLPVIIGGELIEPGDIVRGDADGVCIVRRAEADDIARKSEIREAAEADYINQYKAGKSVIEVSKLEKVLAAKGLVVEE
jgi:regulator of RNase E activity RraA